MFLRKIRLKFTTRWNKNTSTKKNGSAKTQKQRYEWRCQKNATNWPVTLDNEATPYADVFPTANPAVTDSSASDISPDAHLLSPGLKMDTEIFSKDNINNMADKYTIETTPSPDAPGAYTPNAADQDSVSTDSNSPYSLRNRKITPYSTNTTKN